MLNYIKNLSRQGALFNKLRYFSSESNTVVSHYTLPLQPEELIHEKKRPPKRTKMVCTIGPMTEAPEHAVQLIDENFNMARLNFSHGDHAEHRRQMTGVLEAMSMRPGSHVAMMLDTKGPEVRTGNNVDGKPIFLKAGQALQITTDYAHLGDSKRIACSYQNLPHTTKVGKKILIADGSITGIVKSIDKNIVTVEVMNDGKIGQKKNMCLPGCPITLHTITELDRVDIIDFGLKYRVDMIAVSFTRRGKDLSDLRDMLIQADPIHGPNIQLIAKIENHEAIENIDDIISACDGIMVARGDLGMELPLEKVVIAQKYIVDRTIRGGKYVINATQMLDSMESRPSPTRAEVSDVTNSVLDLVDSTMLSGESANGDFPFESAAMMRKIVQQAEHACDYRAIFDIRKHYGNDLHAIGAVGLSFATKCDLIFLQIKDNHRIAQRLSSWRPKAHICVFTNNPRVKSALAANFGVLCFPPINASTKKKQFEQFLTQYGQEFADGKRTPEKALYLTLDETRGHITSSEVLHV